jgi:hypothetical protein
MPLEGGLGGEAHSLAVDAQGRKVLMRVLMVLLDRPSLPRHSWTHALRCSVVISSTVRVREGPTTSSSVFIARFNCETLDLHVLVPYHLWSATSMAATERSLPPPAVTRAR